MIVVSQQKKKKNNIQYKVDIARVETHVCVCVQEKEIDTQNNRNLLQFQYIWRTQNKKMPQNCRIYPFLFAMETKP